eukprot:5805070-Pleurochrysis_carterae.AAC.1
MLGTHTWYAPGLSRLRPRLIPTHARGSMRVFEKEGRGFTAYARQPKGRIGMIRGFCPNVGCVKHGVGPERSRRVTRDKVRSRQFHDRSNRSFCHAVQLMYMWRTRGSVHAVGRQKVGEFAREEFARIVAVQGAHDARGRWAPGVE